QGNFLWNSGMFLWRLDALEEAFHRYLPEVGRALPHLAAGRAPQVYGTLPAVSIDVGVMEKAEQVWVLPAAIGWSDVGNWSAVGALLTQDGDGNGVRGNHLGIDTRRWAGVSVADGDGEGTGLTDDHLVVTIGLEDLVVVRTAQATLICPRDQVQEVREVVKRLEAMGREDLV